MSVCIVTQSGLCEQCSKLGIPNSSSTASSPERVLELNDLCRTDVRKLRTSFVTAVNAKRKEILRSVMDTSPWYKKHGIPEWMGRDD